MPPSSPPWKNVAIYALFGSAWILCSDYLLRRFYPAIDDIIVISIAKGLLFIVVTSVLLYFLFARQKKEMSSSREALRHTEERFQFLVENSSDTLVVINAEGFQRYVSHGAEKMFGFSREELENKPVREIVHPEDLGAVEEAWRRLREEHLDAVTVQYRHIHKNGGWIDCEAVARDFLADPTIRGVIASVRDISKRKRTEEELRESNQFISTILDNLPIGLAVNYIDEGTATYMNDKFQEIYGWPKEELRDIEQFFIKVYPDEAYREQLKARVMEDMRSGAPERMFWTDIQATTKEGATRIIEATNIPIPAQNLMISTVQDITESRKLQKQLEQVQKLESIGRLAGGVAHDFNNLLTPILGYSEILLEEGISGNEREGHVAEIRKAGLRARDLVQQLLAFSRKQILQFKAVDINATIRSFEKLLRRTIPEDIGIEFLLKPGLPKIRGDAGQIEQVLMNLAVNSADAMPGGGRLTLATGRTVFDTAQVSTMEGVTPGTYVTITVTDTGCGMDEETAAHVFEPFFSTKGEYGTGLGLATVYGIIKQHTGNIWVSSRPGHGTTFRIFLPVAEEEPAKEEAREKESSLTGKETILLAEDAYQVRALGRRYLEKFGYTVLEAENGERAMALAEAYDGPIHLLLTDVVMPGINGPQLYEKMAERHPGIKVLYMSGYSGRVIAHRGVLGGDVPFIQKPFDQNGLAKAVRRVLEQ